MLLYHPYYATISHTYYYNTISNTLLILKPLYYYYATYITRIMMPETSSKNQKPVAKTRNQ
jgi:hypothetical protein